MNDDSSEPDTDAKRQLMRAQLVGKLGSWEVDLARNVLTWSDMVFSIFEIGREEFGGTEDSFFALIHPEDLPAFLKAREEWLAQGGPFLFEHRIITPAGKVKWVVERAEILANETGEPEFTTGTVQDVTDLKQAEEARDRVEQELSRKERLVRLAAVIGKIGGWRLDVEANRLEWTDEVAEIHEEPTGVVHTLEGALDYYTPEHRQRVRASIEAAVEQGRVIDDTFQILTTSGRLVWVQMHGEVVRDESHKVIAVEGAIQDITSIKHAEEELLRQARRRRFAGRLASLGSWRFDIGDTHVMWCEETAAIHDEPEGTSPTVEDGISYYIPEHRDRIRKRFGACVSEGDPFDEILQIVTAKGRRVWVRALGEPIRDRAGQIIAVEGAFQDVTDLIAARDEAARLSARLRQTLEGMSEAFFLLDDDWKFAFVNSRAATLLQRTKDDLIGRNIWDAFPEAVGTVFQKEYERAVSEGHPVQLQEYFSPLEAWFEIHADPTPAGLAVYFEDITRQRARDTQLRLLETAISRQNDILLITEAEPIDAPDGPRIVYVNDAFERRTGYSREEVIGLTPRILQGPKTQRDELDRIRAAMKQWRPVRAELINYTKSGEAFWIEIDIAPIADETGWFTHWVAIERDITARKETEEVLQANEERFRLVTKAAGTAIWDWNVKKGQQWWSEGLHDIFGHVADPSGAVPTIWRQHLHPDDMERVNAAFKRLMSGQDTILQEQYRFRRADGSWAFVEDTAFALHDDKGDVLRVLGSMTDVTEQRLLEDRLRQAQKMETVGQLTGGVAHDFNNLLTIILGNAELLEEDLEDRPDLRSMARLTAEAAERGSELTQRLLAFSRKQVLEPKITNVAHLIQGMDGLLRRTLRENIDIEIIRAGGLWLIEVDTAQLESALLNLCVNARDAMPDGGYLTVEVANAMLDDDYVALEPDVRPGQYVVISVTDTGHGIPSDVVDRVFEPFFTTKETGKGSGLGLSMVFGFVKQSGGHIRIYSEPHKGTAVKMYFPRSKAEPERIVTEHARRRIMGGNETILVVEDDAAVRKYVTTQLNSLGYHVLEAANGTEAMDVLARTPVDLLFTDVVMPGAMGGRELAEAARDLYPGLRILFTSGYTENSIVHQGRLDQGIRLLNKPYRRELLAQKIREALDELGS